MGRYPCHEKEKKVRGGRFPAYNYRYGGNHRVSPRTKEERKFSTFVYFLRRAQTKLAYRGLERETDLFEEWGEKGCLSPSLISAVRFHKEGRIFTGLCGPTARGKSLEVLGKGKAMNLYYWLRKGCVSFLA